MSDTQVTEKKEKRQRRPVSRDLGQDAALADTDEGSARRVLRHGQYRISDLTGLRFARWSVLGYESGAYREPYWRCRCECGVERVVRGSALRAGKSKSCGCLCADLCSARFLEHGGRMSGNRRSPEYTTWINIRERCENQQSVGYPNYGGRGIVVCEEWRASFTTFLDDMGPRPGRGYSIDRINNDGPYAPWNCRWATTVEQGRNRRTNRLLTLSGETMCLTAWAERVGLSKRCLAARLDSGMAIDEAMSRPMARRR